MTSACTTCWSSQRFLGSFLLVALLASVGYTQNLDNIGKERPIVLSGGVQVNNVFYRSAGGDVRRDPYNYFLSSNLDARIYGIRVPLQFSYSNQQVRFHQPFNQLGASPVYKGVTAHIGYRSMSFSSYTVSGHVFLGGGLELQANSRWKFAGFYGRLRRKVMPDSLVGVNTSVFKRMGGGLRIVRIGEKVTIGGALFKAGDLIDEMVFKSEKQTTMPEDNLVMSLDASATIADRVKVTAEFASSAISVDSRAERSTGYGIYRYMGSLFSNRVSTGYYHAWKANLQYSFWKANVGMVYERVDPGYRTLGAYYFNNDLEVFALTGSMAIWENKLRFNGQMGMQRNNLNGKALDSMNRMSYSGQVAYNSAGRLTGSVSFSNFTTIVNIRPITDYLPQTSLALLDTLNYRQAATTGSLQAQYMFSSSRTLKQSLTINGTMQRTIDQSAQQVSGYVIYYNFNAGYSCMMQERKATLNVAINGNVVDSKLERVLLGPVVTTRKELFDRKMDVSTSWSRVETPGNRFNSSITNWRFRIGCRPRKRHAAELSATRMIRLNEGEQVHKQRETIVQVGYSYSFELLK